MIAGEAFMDKQQLIQMVRQIYDLHANGEVDCESCQAELDCLAELAVVGYECGDILPAVKNHIDCCRSCRELFRGLVTILKAEQSTQS